MPVSLTAPLPAIGAGEFSLMLLLLIAIVVPVAAIAFARSGRGLDELGRGRFAVDFDRDDREDNREDELRQLVEARAWRQRNRGETPADVEAEVERILALDPNREPVAGDTVSPATPASGPEPSPPTENGIADPPGVDPVLREEIRQVVVARNESRRRRGEVPLDVEAEIDRLADGLE